ncbi:MAG: hypothetical protein A2W35_12590 [Chloroflexi bacterium RBG_16_57_11]|nr:MAG: hypothetical protein A2W35_12590 [Chloroflexi bacterium RBG_16_57_11]
MESASPPDPLEPSSDDVPALPSAREQAWATPVSKLKVSGLPEGAINLNVDGRQITNPLQGFGQLWQKTYRVRLSGAKATPQQVIAEWRSHFPEFWPAGNRFYGSLTTIQPGEVAVLNLAGPGGIKGPGGAPLISTGVLVIYADDESFSFLTPQGHMFNGLITFSAADDDGVVIAQVQALVRASDPIYEMSFRLGFGHKAENEFWIATLQNLAARFGVTTQARQEVALIDPGIQWSQAKNVWHNAAIRTGLYYVAAPFRWARKKLS